MDLLACLGRPSVKNNEGYYNYNYSIKERMRPTTPIPDGCSFTLLACQIKLPSEPRPPTLKRVQSTTSIRNGKNSHHEHSRISLKQIKSPKSSPYESRQFTQPDPINRQYHQAVPAVPVSPYFVGTPKFRNQFMINQHAKLKTYVLPNRPTVYAPNPPAALPLSPRLVIVDSNAASGKIMMQKIHTPNFKTRTSELSQRQANEQMQKDIANSYVQTEDTYVQEGNSVLKDKSQQNKQNYRHDTVGPIRAASNVYQSDMMSPSSRPRGDRKIAHSNIVRFEEGLGLEFRKSYQKMDPVMRQSLPASLQVFGSYLKPKRLSVEREDSEKTQSKNKNFHSNIMASPSQEYDLKETTSFFPKKMNTLVDLGCKSVSSDRDDKTSSNHISILDGHESIASSASKSSKPIPAVEGGGCEKLMKFMTLKSMPLRENW